MADAPYHLTEDPTSLSGAPAHPKALPGRDTLYVSLLGGFLIEAPNGSAALPSRKAQAILAYLLLQPTRSASRESIAGLLWSGGTEDLARASLRQALRRLNQYFEATGVFGIEVTRNEVRLNISCTTGSLPILKIALASARAGPGQMRHKSQEMPRSLFPISTRHMKGHAAS